jgi:MarR family transcriptional regulator, transcriptional regulator for hemolysin
MDGARKNAQQKPCNAGFASGASEMSEPSNNRRRKPASTANPDALESQVSPGGFIEVRSGHPAGSLEDMKLRFTRRVIFIARRWRNMINDGLREVGHSHARWITLTWIDILDGKSNHRVLAERVGVELPTLIRLLNRLEKEGLVERRAFGPRAKTVTLTPTGRTTLAELQRITLGVRTAFLADVDPEKLEISLALLDELLVRTGDADSGV